MTDVPLAKALLLVEKLIAGRMRDLQSRALTPGLSSQVSRSLNQRFDEMGKLLGEIKAARLEQYDERRDKVG